MKLLKTLTSIFCFLLMIIYFFLFVFMLLDESREYIFSEKVINNSIVLTIFTFAFFVCCFLWGIASIKIYTNNVDDI